jgi:hypothetical protein
LFEIKVAAQGVSLCYFHVYMYYTPIGSSARCRVLQTTYTGWPWIVILLFSASQLARITGVKNMHPGNSVLN